MFAPLSPTSSRRLERIHQDHPHNHNSDHDLDVKPPRRAQTYDPELKYQDDMVYDDPSSPDEPRRRHRRRRRRRNSDPSSNRPTRSRRRDAHTRSPSPSSSDIEELPPRFDRDGRPIDGSRSGGGGFGGGGLGDILSGLGGSGDGEGKQEMVEKVVRTFGDVVDGRTSWREMVGTLLGGADLSGGERRRR